ncbi:SE1832 family protein [Peribacillus sp. SCS-26]|uniref:SE1832 family protein n=1 Tax=Paraperibacillus marinus TaxID=3115295 RepID=UPI003905D0DB
MTKSEIEYKIQDLKSDYILLQNDLEKLESVDGNISPLERQLSEIEEGLASLNQQLREL